VEKEQQINMEAKERCTLSIRREVEVRALEAVDQEHHVEDDRQVRRSGIRGMLTELI